MNKTLYTGWIESVNQAYARKMRRVFGADAQNLYFRQTSEAEADRLSHLIDICNAEAAHVAKAAENKFPMVYTGRAAVAAPKLEPYKTDGTRHAIADNHESHAYTWDGE